LVTVLIIFLSGSAISTAQSHNDLITLFNDWRTFEQPPMTENGAPNYTAATFLSP